MRNWPSIQFDRLGGPRLLAEVDCWYVSLHSYSRHTCRDACRKLAEQGKSMNVYGHVPDIDADTGSEARKRFVPLWIERIRRYLPWTGTMWNFDDPFGGSAGMLHLIYPGQPVGYDGPVLSIRLKHWRRALLDVEYLQLASKRIGRHRAVQLARDALARTTPQAWLEFKKRLAATILKDAS